MKTIQPNRSRPMTIIIIAIIIAASATMAVMLPPRLLLPSAKRAPPDARAIRHFGMGGGGL